MRMKFVPGCQAHLPHERDRITQDEEEHHHGVEVEAHS